MCFGLSQVVVESPSFKMHGLNHKTICIVKAKKTGQASNRTCMYRMGAIPCHRKDETRDIQWIEMTLG